MNSLFEAQEVTISELLRRIEALEAVVYRNEERGRTAKSLQVPEALRHAWAAWDAYRKPGKRWTADAKARSLRDLVEHSGGRASWAEAIVDRSIKSGWVGLFALPPEMQPKEAPKTGIRQIRPEETPEERQRAFERRMRELGLSASDRQ